MSAVGIYIAEVLTEKIIKIIDFQCENQVFEWFSEPTDLSNTFGPNALGTGHAYYIFGK